MQFLRNCFLPFLLTSVLAMTTIGCGLGTVVIDPVQATASSQMQPIQGSDFGGHAPLVGAHVYLTQPGATGYGSLVKGILVPPGSAKYPTTKNGQWPVSGSGYVSDQLVPALDASGNPFYGVTSDANGVFYITGDYTCTVGQPVFLVAYGGKPSFAGTVALPQANTSQVTTQELYADGTGYWFTYTTTSPELFYVGESVAVTGNPALSAGFNATSTILASGKHYDGTAAPLTANSFSFYLPFSAYPSGGLNIPNTTTPSFAPSPASGVQAVGTPLSGTGAPTNFNPAVVNMAVLGNCPQSGNFTTATATAPVTASSIASNVATFTASNTFSVGQQVTLSGFLTTTAFNGVSATITSASATQFAVAFPHANVATGGAGTATVQGAPLNFVYMNEVSTVAAAYAFAAFTNTSAASQAGNDEFHIGAPSTPQAQVGITNAALTAANLFDIQGSNTSTSFAGEGHIARATTASAVGTVPQALLDTLGNILAACVDSTNTYLLNISTQTGVGTQSAACKTLFQYASDNGVYNPAATTHQPMNTAQAAFNLARFPQGAGTSTVSPGTATTAAAFVNALVGLPTGNVPFTPNLGATAPNDFSVAIRWSNVGSCPLAVSGGTRCSESGMDIDAQGNVWSTAQVYAPTAGGTSVGAVMELSPAGNLTVYNPPSGGSISNVVYNGFGVAYPAGTSQTTGTSSQPGLAIDPAGTVYAPGTSGVYKFTAGNPTGVQANANGVSAGGLAVDATNLYLMSNGGTVNAGLLAEPAAGGNPALNLPGALLVVPISACEYKGGFVTVDSVGNIWTDKVDQQDLLNGNAVCEFNSSGQLLYSYQTLGILNGAFFFPEQLATDNGNNVFFTDKNTNTVGKILANQGTPVLPGVNIGVTLFTGPTSSGKLNGPRGVAIDGANTLWVSNNGNGSIARFDDNVNGLSPYFYGSGFSYTDPRTGSAKTVNDLNFLSVDQSGNVWAGGSNDGQIFQFVGLAAPTVNPLSYAKRNAMVGVQP